MGSRDNSRSPHSITCFSIIALASVYTLAFFNGPLWAKGGGGRGLIVTAAKPRHRAHELGRIHAQQIDYLRYAYATIDAIAPDAQTSSRAV